MHSPDFAPVAASFEAALTEWFEERREGVPTGGSTVATNSTAVADRGRPLLDLLVSRGVTTLEGRRLLDLGCGFGALAAFFAWRGASVTGIDRNTATLRVGAAVAEEHGLDVHLFSGAMERLDVPAESFDIAVMNNTLCYLLDDEARHAALVGARRALRPGGVLVLRDLNGLHPVDQFSRLPFLGLLSPERAVDLAARFGVRDRPAVRLLPPWRVAGSLRRAGFSGVVHQADRPGPVARLVRPVARYQHFTAERPG